MLIHQLVIKLYPLHRIVKFMQQLEGFHYVTALYVNTEYYTIRLSPTSQDMTTIVTDFGRLRYNCLPMGMWALGDISQLRVYELLGYIEGVKTYIYNILVLSKD